ncbi:putative gamma-soluble NSF attachment protein [Monocercomonoides exilis]|uniref:putative gamma-soluble NSF attachment protein n=1 Tax=Monocercomonoides exilis TaxID=2049356 RepID=UPI00355A9262|nr:putative gamma-soluble NSF attachment protein [Monocercomonoides exilis]|eukprot:MONOS_567.1-p1 / transcript=MONOS_567.1 / gene=MONOS_567 / organism=Monocercomonoides_exilis_PA203 / gene_product=unspecified product / transcript_product=unspecified product / location=Mono_scaffold00009:76616-78248(-) / protein_length=338 / sequence_SO=supercontig / SO=protein_coding / is_pseudo=false
MSKISVDAAGMKKKAEAAIKEGVKMGTKGFFNRHPDYCSAAKKVEEGSKMLRLAGDDDASATAMIQAAEFFALGDNANGAGKLYESAGNIRINQGRYDEAIQLLQKCQEMLRIAGNANRAGEALKNAAIHITESNPEKSFELFTLALEIYHDEDNLHFFEDTFQYYLVAMAKAKNWDLALKEIPRRIENAQKLKRPDTQNKMILTMVIIHLANKDLDGANQTLSQYMSMEGFEFSNDCDIASKLISAIQMGDQDSLDAVLKQQYIAFLPLDISRLAKSLKVFTPKSNPLTSFAPTSVEKDEEQYDSGYGASTDAPSSVTGGMATPEAGNEEDEDESGL